MSAFITLAEIERDLRGTPIDERLARIRANLGMTVEQAIFAGARWLIERRGHLPNWGGHGADELRTRFGLDSEQATEAVRHADATTQRGA